MVIPISSVLPVVSVLFTHGSCSVAHIPQEDHLVDHGPSNKTRYETIQRSADEDWDLHQPKAGIYGSSKVHTHFGETHGYENNMTTVYMILIGFIAYLFLLLFDALGCWRHCSFSSKADKSRSFWANDFKPVLV